MYKYNSSSVTIRDLSPTGVAIFFDDEYNRPIKANYYYNTMLDRNKLKDDVPEDIFERIMDAWRGYPILRDNWMITREVCKPIYPRRDG